MISVIVPIYNVENYIGRCLDSIQNQSYIDFEVLMVDDGSTDSSSCIAKRYAADDSRFIYIYQENSGQGGARNHGIRESHGDYICFVDSDDYIHQQYLELLHDSICSGADISSCGVERVYENGKKKDYKITNQSKSTEITDIRKYLLSASFSVCNKLFRKELFEGLEFPSNIKFEDFALMPMVYERATKIISIENKLYYYYYRENSTTTGTKINPDILKAQRILEDSPFGQRNPDITKMYFVRQVMGTLLWAMCQSQKYRPQVMTIMDCGLAKYPDLKNYMADECIGTGKHLWGLLLVYKRYKLAFAYPKLYESLKSFVKSLINR